MIWYNIIPQLQQLPDYIQVIHIALDFLLYFIGMFMWYKYLELPKWKSLVPMYNLFPLCKKIERINFAYIINGTWLTYVVGLACFRSYGLDKQLFTPYGFGVSSTQNIQAMGIYMILFVLLYLNFVFAKVLWLLIAHKYKLSYKYAILAVLSAGLALILMQVKLKKEVSTQNCYR